MRLYKIKPDSFDNFKTESDVFGLYKKQLKESEELETQFDLLEEARLNYNVGPYSSFKL
jgi:hypothetical protein